jgi:membrane fusion protein (multidrug efflux system)
MQADSQESAKAPARRDAAAEEATGPSARKSVNGNGSASAAAPAVPAATAVEPAAPAKSARKPYTILAVIALVVGVAIVGYLKLTAGQESTDDAQITADLVPVGARVAGQIKEVLVRENQRVKKGDVVARIDDADFVARVQQAEAELASADAQAQQADAEVDIVSATSKGTLSSAKAAFSGSSVGVASADAQVASAHAAEVRAAADLRKAEADLKRAQELRQANAVPQEQLDNAQAAFDSARAQVDQARAGSAAALEGKRAAQARVSEAYGRVTQSAPIDAQVAAAHAKANLAHARVKSAQAALSLAKLQLSYTTIVSPADGLASKLSVHDGQLVAIGQPIVELVPLATYVIANFKETQIGAMRGGQRAKIKIDAFPGREFEGKVESISGGTGSSFSLLPADNASGNFVKVVQRVPVRIAWTAKPADLDLRAGLSVEATVFTEN